MSEQEDKPFDSSFRLMYSSQRVELASYVLEVMEREMDAEIHVGCDSQNYRTHTVYVTTVVFRYPGRGAHVIYRKDREKKINDMFVKLWGELERSLATAMYIKQKTGFNIQQIDLDYNEDPLFASHKVLQAASGYVQSMGFTPKNKPNLLMATWAANLLCH